MSETPDFIPPAANPGAERDTAMPRFYTKAVQNNFKTQKEGRPIFEDVEFVEILIPGDRRSNWDGLVRDEHRHRWPRQYGAFKAQMELPTEGTPLVEWPGVTRAQAEELSFAHVKTVEQLAALSDDNLNKTLAMGGFALREKAKRFIEQAAGNAPMEKLAAENEQLRAKVSELEGTVGDFEQRFQALERGRPGPDQA